jgi:hypothetical protein
MSESTREAMVERASPVSVGEGGSSARFAVAQQLEKLAGTRSPQG